MRVVYRLLILIGIVSLLLVFAGTFFAGTLTKKTIEVMGPRIAGVDIQVADVNVSMMGGNASIEGVVVHNPESFKSDFALKLNKIFAEVDISSASTDTFIIKEIKVMGPEINYEMGLGGTNIGKIRSNIAESTKSSADELAKEEAAQEPKEKKNIMISRLVIVDAKVNMIIAGVATPIALPRIELTNLGKGGNASLEAIVAEVVEALAGAVGTLNVQGLGIENLGAGAKNVLEGAGGLVKGAGEGAGGLLKGVGEGAGGLLKGAGEGAGGAVKGAGDALKDLF